MTILAINCRPTDGDCGSYDKCSVTHGDNV